MFNFEKLLVWEKAILLADEVYRATKKFPDEERFGLTAQMRRAATSISSNIAEGASRHSPPDYVRFVEIATGSVFEVVSQSFIASRQGYLCEDSRKNIYDAGLEIVRMLSGLRDSIGRR